jgi:hypothetical protein
MKQDDDRMARPPLAYRWLLSLGRPFGWRWVPDNHLGAVYHMERYRDLRGPGFFRINPLTESVKVVVSLNPDFISANIPSLNTHDGVQLGLQVALAYEFDPRKLPAAKAQIFVKWPPHILRAIATDSATRTLLSIVARHTAQQICRGEVFDAIDRAITAELAQRLEPLAIKPVLAMVLRVITPPTLQETFTDAVNRDVYTEQLWRFEEYELNEVRRREMNAVLSEIPGGIRYLNLPGGEVNPPAGQAGSLPRPKTIRGTSTPRSYLAAGPDDDDEALQ